MTPEEILSEETLPDFFPKLKEGVMLQNKEYLWIERNNLPNIYDIDYCIMYSGQNVPIAYIDNEHRYDDYIFTHKNEPVNIPIYSHRSNIEQLESKKLSGKVRYYIRYPFQTFHLTRHPNYVEAICSRGIDFINTTPIEQQDNVIYGNIAFDMIVWQCPRNLTCYGKTDESTIENWLLSKLNENIIPVHKSNQLKLL